ncbi:MAG: (2Fe-2S)-binding protein [Chloroflexi bacterium]|nr:(2Fe-2S)-binding protein [Chloroflexota bacterium]MCI0578081.1 (2Fe-2S)-binding protein [Chloroflexota bacterium]MCI0646069.1 (2Fe-2S)-binding protein [Chloroflexota bacterium]MCI0730993.1 (2Fe-2S)-binding protein [Chloroflexota bacterium]
MTTYQLHLTVNEHPVVATVEPHLTLLEFLRDTLGLTGTKEGCSTGHCGACTVVADGDPISPCLMLAAEADGRDILTVEGLGANGELHPIQAAFVTKGGLQCGFCTSGMLLAALTLLKSNPQPAEAEIRRSLAGNLCRCTGYQKIIEAVQQAAEEMNHGR